MYAQYALTQRAGLSRRITLLPAQCYVLRTLIYCPNLHRRSSTQTQYDDRNRLSNFFIPTQRRSNDATGPEHGHDLLIRAGFLRQAYSGIFHLLPLGLRVLNKLESLIDKHMRRLGASKASLSSLSSEDLWQRSGRLDKGRTSELLRLEDRKGAKYLLSPTHEEEITTIIANTVHSYKDLPLRLYQVSRKYRDEPRPRQGLLRGREFLMKDLYTFDATEDAARKTYELVREAYVAFLEDLKLPYIVARADSGNMGGTLSHEYHFASSSGEDTIISCDTCDYSINEELYIGKYDDSQAHSQGGARGQNSGSNPESSGVEISSEHYVSKDRTKMCSIHYATKDGEPNVYALKALFPTVDPGLQGEPAIQEIKDRPLDDHVHYRDPRLSRDKLDANQYETPTINGQPILLTKAREGDVCQNCHNGSVKLRQAVEIGHTFHLGQRYSIPLEAHILNANNQQVPIEMGCHGIGVSRIIGAIAALLSDSKGLNWPLAISPFDIVIVPAGKTETSDIETIYDRLSHESQNTSDAVIDDREKPVGWKLNDADLIGYPFIVVVGNAWKDRGVVQLQCRRLGLKLEIGLDELPAHISEAWRKL